MGTTVELAPGAETEIVILFGDADGPEQAAALIARYRDADLDAVLAEVREQWEGLLGTVQVKTPDRSIDIMLNGWLLYQTIACRLWARSGFYQASGAYGFRDQLQDGMALAAIRPSLTREHLVRAAGRQFAEGDVQHWWLPHSGQGVRTRISDDRVWLAFCVAHYLETTGDASLLDEAAPFLEGPGAEGRRGCQLLRPHRLGQNGERLRALRARPRREPCARRPRASPDRGRRLERRHEQGRGGGQGRKRLARLAFAHVPDRLCGGGEVTRRCGARGEVARPGFGAAKGARARGLGRRLVSAGMVRRRHADRLARRATNAGSISIAQSWAVMSGAANPERASRAMAAVERELIRGDDGLALLFTPPFDRTDHDPGYIKGYPPGIRENGGQYTHAAAWSVIALARLGEGAKAASLFWMLNPINHARSRSDLRRYKVEPYVVAADVYSAADHVGRGGWTWYTGSAAWLYRAGMEEILGLRLTGSALHLDPCIPESWPGFEVTLRRGSTRFDIRVDNPERCRKGDRIGADRRNRDRRAAASASICPRTARAMRSWSSWAEAMSNGGC